MRSNKVLKFTFLSVLFLLLIVCSSKPTESGKNEFTIGVNQYVHHPILDDVLKGLKEKLDQKDSYHMIIKNSNGDNVTSRMINEQFINSDVDIIVALGTPAAQSAIQVADEIPVVFGAITDPVGAGLADTMEKPGGNKTGTTNRWPFKQHVMLLKDLLPNARKVGLVINPGEENCMAGVKVFRVELDALGIEVIERPATTTSEVHMATESLMNRVDVILITPSNTVFAALPTLIDVAKKHKVPVIGGDESAVQKGSLATYGFSSLAVGAATADVVVEVLEGNLSPGDIPVKQPPQSELYLNKKSFDYFGIAIPDKLRQSAKIISD